MIQSVLVVGDEQYPYHDKAAIRAVRKYARSRVWDAFVHLGDGLDFDAISSFSARDLEKLGHYNFLEDYRGFGRHLDEWSAAVEHQARAKKKAMPRKYFLEGNHEYRIEPYLQQHPQLRGILEVPKALDLAGRGYEWIPSWSKGEMLTIGHANFIHGVYVNMNHAKKHALAYGCNIFYGHTHDVQQQSVVFQGKGRSIVGQSLGCLCEEQDYMRGKPNNWQQAFGVFFINDESGYFSYFVPRIFHNKGVAEFIAPDGKMYTSR